VPPGPPDELPHAGAPEEEWLFVCWTSGGTAGLLSGYRIRRPARPGWYWAALVRRGEPLLHVAEWDVPGRVDPLLVKAPGLWAEHTIDVPMVQWTVANETYAAALDDPDDALGRAYGVPTAVAFDLEWYATAEPVAVVDGYVQDGVVHGLVELAGGALHLEEVAARRWHRWGAALAPVALDEAFAHTGLRAPFAFPDGTVADWVLTPDGWRELAQPAQAPRPAEAPVVEW
jgi:hypothetical protein